MVQPSFPEWMPVSDWRPPDTFPEISGDKYWSLDVESRDEDLESRGPGYIRGDAYVAGVAIATDGFRGYYPVRHLMGGNLAPNVVFDWLRDQVKHFRGELYGGNLLYDEEALWFENIKFSDDVKRCDIQIAEPLIDEESPEGYSVEALSQKYLGVGKEEGLLRDAASRYTKGYKDKRARRPIPFDPKGDLWKLPPEYVGAYGEGDVDRPLRIFRDHQSKILDSEDLGDIFKLETSLTPILLRMRIAGIAVDLEAAHKLVKVLTSYIDKFSMEIKALVGFDPNVDSGQDMAKAYNILNFKLPEFDVAANLRLTAAGNPSFAADWYAVQRDPLSRLVLKKKKLMTLRDDFVIGDIIKESVNGRLHCQFQQLKADNTGTRSGRMAARNPNLQQVPARHDGCDKGCPKNCTAHVWAYNEPVWADEVRKLFVADAGKRYFKGDYSQQEPRLLVHYASLLKLQGADLAVKAFRANPLVDYHQLTTDIINEKSGKHFKRKQIKGVNLGIMYSMGLKKLCRMLGVSIPEGMEILKEYHAALPFVKKLSSKAMSIAEDRGFIRTLLRRKRRFNLWEPVHDENDDPNYRPMGLTREQAEQVWPNRRLQRYGIHKALNALIQGSAADETKEAMRVLYYDHKYVAALQVHDELGGSVVDIEEARMIKEVMETCVILQIPVVCDAKLGPSWGEAREAVNRLAA
jgi:DNA polymerase I-like protein with 3'-5' exonuclease and polymerase domains